MVISRISTLLPLSAKPILKEEGSQEKQNLQSAHTTLVRAIQCWQHHQPAQTMHNEEEEPGRLWLKCSCKPMRAYLEVEFHCVEWCLHTDKCVCHGSYVVTQPRLLANSQLISSNGELGSFPIGRNWTMVDGRWLAVQSLGAFEPEDMRVVCVLSRSCHLCLSQCLVSTRAGGATTQSLICGSDVMAIHELGQSGIAH